MLKLLPSYKRNRTVLSEEQELLTIPDHLRSPNILVGFVLLK
jgi:hypothetical protein